VIEDVPFASLLLDAGAVLALARDRPEAWRWLHQAKEADIRARVCLVTVAEVFRDRPSGARVQWVLSRLVEEPFTWKNAQDAGRLLGVTGSAGRTIDAIVAATAVRMPKPVAVLTSDPKDLAQLLDGQRRVIVAQV
jgi:predicted nucleic acid-binding protein